MKRDLATACVLCSHNCGLRVDVDDNRVVAVRPDTDNPISHGYSCNKAYSIAHYIEHAQRVRSPLKRRADGSFEAVTWDAAIMEIGTRLRAIVQQSSPQAFAFVGGGGQANHLDLAYASAFRLALGSPWWFNALAQEKTQHPLVDSWLFDAPAEAWLEADIDHSTFVVLLGTNPALSNRGRNATQFLKALRAPGRTLVVVDPRRSETALSADVHVALRPGSDVYLLLGMAAQIVQGEHYDRAFMAKHVADAAGILRLLRRVDVRDMAARCQIEVAQLEALATRFASASAASMYMDLGLEQGLFSTLTSYLMRLIAVLTGNLGRRGGMVFHGLFAPKSPPFGRRPFVAPVSGIESIEALAPLGMFSPNLLPEEILRAHPQRIRAVIVEGANPVVQYADTSRYREALAQLDLLVVIDPAMSETAQLADFVLPTPVGYEKWEYSGFPKHYPDIHAQLRPPVVEGPPHALPEAEIYARLMRACGMSTRAPKLLHKLASKALDGGARAGAFVGALSALAAARGGSTDAIVARMLFWAYDALGPHLAAPALTSMWLLAQMFALTRRADILRAYPAQRALKNPFALGSFLYERMLQHPEGVLVGRVDEERNLADHCRFWNGKVRLSPPLMLKEIERALCYELGVDREYPFVLNGGRRTHWNANTIQRDPAWRKGKGPHCPLFIHPDDARALSLDDGAQVRLETRRGAVELPIRCDATMRPGHVAIPNGFGLVDPPKAGGGPPTRTGVAINELTDASERDPFTGSPHHKYVRCRLLPASAP